MLLNYRLYMNTVCPVHCSTLNAKNVYFRRTVHYIIGNIGREKSNWKCLKMKNIIFLKLLQRSYEYHHIFHQSSTIKNLISLHKSATAGCLLSTRYECSENPKKKVQIVS